MISLTFFLFLAFFLSSPSSSSSYVIVLTATQEELNPLLSKLSVYDIPCLIEIAGRELFLFKSREWVVGATGMGTTNAATLVQALLLYLQDDIEIFYFTGTAGGLDPITYKIGDTVIPHYWMEYTFQRWLRKEEKSACLYNTKQFVDAPTRWMHGKGEEYVQFLSDGECCCDKNGLGIPIAIPLLRKRDEKEEERFFFPVDSTLYQHVVKKAKQAFHIKTPLYGVSGSVFLDNRHLAESIHTQIGVDTVDMESTAFMQVCELNGFTRCIVVRTISDFSGLNISSPINVYKKNANVIEYLIV